MLSAARRSNLRSLWSNFGPGAGFPLASRCNRRPNHRSLPPNMGCAYHRGRQAARGDARPDPSRAPGSPRRCRISGRARLRRSRRRGSPRQEISRRKFSAPAGSTTSQLGWPSHFKSTGRRPLTPLTFKVAIRVTFDIPDWLPEQTQGAGAGLYSFGTVVQLACSISMAHSWRLA